MNGRDAVYLSSVDGGVLWQVHHEMAVRLARAGNRVFYVENTGIRSPGVADARRVVARLRSRARALRSHGWRSVSPSLYTHSPLVMPPFGGALSRVLNRC